MNWRDFLLLTTRLAAALTQAQAVAAVQIGDGIIQVLDAVRQEPARSLIRDAMIVYEPTSCAM